MRAPAILLLALTQLLELGAQHSPALWIDRGGLRAYTLDASGRVLLEEAAGIGRGGRRQKKSMSDLITPTGHFVVDLILSSADSSRNAILPSLRSRYAADPSFGPLVEDQKGLARLFDTMNALDFIFNGDHAADGAYGTAYIGLDSPTVLTGPKMHWYASRAYWFSIALHGTPLPASALGKATSGGCVHLSRESLERLLGSRHLQLGSTVVIADEPPPEPVSLSPSPPPDSPPPDSPPAPWPRPWFKRWPNMPRFLGWHQAIGPRAPRPRGAVARARNAVPQSQAGLSGEPVLRRLGWLAVCFGVACCLATFALAVLARCRAKGRPRPKDVAM